MKEKASNDARVSANRRNAKKSTGPNNTSSTRFNARKHGLLCAGITELDDADGYRETLGRLGQAYLDEVDAFLVERVALHMVRLRRTARLEAEFITSILNPPKYGPSSLEMDFPLISAPLIDPGLPASIGSKTVEALVSTYERYESANENRFFRTLHQLERVRRIRNGEQLRAPTVADVTIRSETRDLDDLADFMDPPSVEVPRPEPSEILDKKLSENACGGESKE